MKALIVFGLFIAALSFAAGVDYSEAMQEVREAYPGLINGSNPEIIRVIFDNGAFLDLGKNITPTEAKNQPIEVDWNADKDSFYTLLVCDADSPSLNNTYLRDVVMWMVGNIPGKDVAAGDVIYEYIGHAPAKYYGLNRYFYFVFKQPKKLKFKEPRVTKNSALGRTNFSVQDFSAIYNLGSPVGVNFLSGYYDPQSNNIYKQLGCCEEFITEE